MQDIINQIKDKIPLYDWIGKDILLTKKGKYFSGCCPFHHEKTPSFYVSALWFKCFGCDIKGDIFEYCIQKNGTPFKEVLVELANYAGVTLPSKKNNFKAVFEKIDLIKKTYIKALSLQKNVLSYLENRQISSNSIQEFMLGWAEQKSPFSKQDLNQIGILSQNGHNLFTNRLIFPIWDDYGQTIGFSGRILEKSNYGPKYCNTSETDFFKKKYILYAYHMAKKHVDKDHPFILVEGFFDVIRLHQNGIKNVVGTMGTALTIENLEKLWKYPMPPILCFDGDLAGMNAAYHTVEKNLAFLTGKNTLQFYFLPEGEDPDSFVKTYGIKEFQNLKKHSVIDVLWDFLLKKHNIHPKISPEEKANFETIWQNMIGKIQDMGLKKFYRQELLKRQKEFYFEHIKKDIAIKIPTVQNLNIKILLFTLIKHPDLTEHVIESLVLLNIQDETLYKICQTMINGEDTSQYESFFEDTLYSFAPFTKAHDQEEVLNGWYDVLEQTLKRDQETLQKQLYQTKKTLERNEWEKFKELKKNVLMTHTKI